MNLWRRLEMEWKVLLLAAVLFSAFSWPIQQFFVSRLSATLEQSVDPHLEQTLRAALQRAEGAQREALLEHIERYRQINVLIPILVNEQKNLLWAFTAGFMILFLILALVILKRLTRPLKNIATAVERIGKGEASEVKQISGGALGTLEHAVLHLQNELVILREKARMQGMEAAWQDIARVMAHEIKNPLTPIRLTLDRIEERIATGGALSVTETARYLSRINAQIDMLERLVNQFRSFSREPDVRVKQVHLVAELQAVADGMTPVLTTNVVGSCAITTDPYLLQQIFLNLWKNALEAGATSLHVVIEPHAMDVVITLTDNGSGIAAEDLDRIWLPYVTIKKGGTGLGLPVVRRLVETLQGSIALTATVGMGVTVTVQFPRIMAGITTHDE